MSRQTFRIGTKYGARYGAGTVSEIPLTGLLRAATSRRVAHYSRQMNSFVALYENFCKDPFRCEIIGGFDAYAPALLMP